MVTERLAEGAPSGNFDLPHLRSIHRHLFQDIYDWAGELRTVEMSKGAQQFMFLRFIGTGMDDIHRRLKETNFLRDLDASHFAEAVGPIIGDINYVHPFREGNGRTQLAYLAELAAQAGHVFDAGKLDPERWIAASIAAHGANYELMVSEITLALGDGPFDH